MMVRNVTEGEDQTFRRLVAAVLSEGPLNVPLELRKAKTQRARFYTWRARLAPDDPVYSQAQEIICSLEGNGLRFTSGRPNPSSAIEEALCRVADDQRPEA